MRSGEGFNPLRSFQSQADKCTRLPLGLGRHCHRQSFFQDNRVSANAKSTGGVGSVCLWLQRIRGALSCAASLQVCRERAFLRSLKESVNRSTAGAMLPRAATPGALWLLVRSAQGIPGPDQSSDAAAHGGLQAEEWGGCKRQWWGGGWALWSVLSQRLSRQCHVGSFPATVTRQAWQESQPRHSALCVQFHTIASFFLTCLL